MLFQLIPGQLDDMHDVIERMQQNFDSAESYRVTSRLLELAGRMYVDTFSDERPFESWIDGSVATLAGTSVTVGGPVRALTMKPAPTAAMTARP